MIGNNSLRMVASMVTLLKWHIVRLAVNSAHAYYTFATTELGHKVRAYFPMRSHALGYAFCIFRFFLDSSRVSVAPRNFIILNWYIRTPKIYAHTHNNIVFLFGKLLFLLLVFFSLVGSFECNVIKYTPN